MKKNSSVYESSKKTIQEFLNSLPKQTGKYAAIFAAVGALVTGALACILTPPVVNNKNVQ